MIQDHLDQRIQAALESSGGDPQAAARAVLTRTPWSELRQIAVRTIAERAAAMAPLVRTFVLDSLKEAPDEPAAPDPDPDHEGPELGPD